MGKSLVEQGSWVELKSGARFKMGSAFKPSWADLRYAMHLLWSEDMHREIAPGVDVKVLLGAKKDVVEKMVPYVLGASFKAITSGEIEWPLPVPVEVALFIFGWYWFHWLDGPEPLDLWAKMPKARTKNYGVTPILGCPFCHKLYVPPKRFKRQSVIQKHWMKWLARHRVEYHKWED